MGDYKKPNSTQVSGEHDKNSNEEEDIKKPNPQEKKDKKKEQIKGKLTGARKEGRNEETCRACSTGCSIY